MDGRLIALGGCGKAAMLIVRRSDFSGLLGARIPETDLGALAFEIEWLRGDLVPNESFGLEGVRALADA